MKLTAEQEKALQAGEPVEMELAGTACVILPKETYRQMTEAEFSPRETRRGVKSDRSG